MSDISRSRYIKSLHAIYQPQLVYLVADTAFDSGIPTSSRHNRDSSILDLDTLRRKQQYFLYCSPSCGGFPIAGPGARCAMAHHVEKSHDRYKTATLFPNGLAKNCRLMQILHTSLCWWSKMSFLLPCRKIHQPLIKAARCLSFAYDSQIGRKTNQHHAHKMPLTQGLANIRRLRQIVMTFRALARCTPPDPHAF